VLTWYIVSNGKVLAEYDGLTKALHYKYMYAGDQRVAMRDGVNRLHYYLNDHLGSARVVIDSAGTVKDKRFVETAGVSTYPNRDCFVASLLAMTRQVWTGRHCAFMTTAVPAHIETAGVSTYNNSRAAEIGRTSGGSALLKAVAAGGWRIVTRASGKSVNFSPVMPLYIIVADKR